MASTESNEFILNINSLLRNTNLSVSISNSCPIIKDECSDLDKAFSGSNVNIVLRENGKVVSCLGCDINEDNTIIHITASCSARQSRRKGFNSLVRLILFNYAQSENINTITADTNASSRPLMEKYLNARCTDQYMAPSYEINCIVDVSDPDTQRTVKNNMKTILQRFKQKIQTRRRIRSKTKSANDALKRSKQSRSSRSRSSRSRSSRSRSIRSRSMRSRSRPSRTARTR